MLYYPVYFNNYTPFYVKNGPYIFDAFALKYYLILINRMERLRIERFLDVCRGNNPTAYGRRF